MSPDISPYEHSDKNFIIPDMDIDVGVTDFNLNGKKKQGEILSDFRNLCRFEGLREIIRLKERTSIWKVTRSQDDHNTIWQNETHMDKFTVRIFSLLPFRRLGLTDHTKLINAVREAIRVENISYVIIFMINGKLHWCWLPPPLMEWKFPIIFYIFFSDGFPK